MSYLSNVMAFKSSALTHMADAMGGDRYATYCVGLTNCADTAVRISYSDIIDPTPLISYLIPGTRLFIASSMCNKFTEAVWNEATGRMVGWYTKSLNFRDKPSLSTWGALPSGRFVPALSEMFTVQLRHMLNIYVMVAMCTPFPRETVAKIVFLAVKMEVEAEKAKMREREREEEMVMRSLRPRVP